MRCACCSSTYGSRGDVEPLVADVRVPLVPFGAAQDGPTTRLDPLSVAPGTALTSETRARGRVVAGTIRTGGTAMAATPQLGVTSRGKSPLSA